MLFVDNHNITDPRINLAIEEYLLREVSSDEPLLLFYINEPSVIIGRNQNTLEEIDPDYVKAKGIHVVRRLSGGGAVYHDQGNLNFSFITSDQKGLHRFDRFTEPVIQVLRKLGLMLPCRAGAIFLLLVRRYRGMPNMQARGECSATEPYCTILISTNC